VAELEAVHGPVARALPLDQFLGQHRDMVLARGLSAMPADRMRWLLRQPRLLLDLQELILTSGGSHWIERAASDPEHQRAVERGWNRLAASFAAEGTATRTDPARPASPRVGRSSWSRHRGLVSLATAAAVLFAVVLVTYRSGVKPSGGVVATSAWGWNRSDALPPRVPRNEYLKHLADGAHEWFNTRPDNPLALARRLAEFRQGCSTLILSPHQPLPVEDRDWLLEKCRGWAGKFDGYLTAVESGAEPLKVRAEADETVNRLIETLRGRADGRA
jgi:hypothetical protein